MECPICSVSFSEGVNVPRSLSKCGHTVCHICLRNLIDSSNSFHMKCPFCPAEYTVEEASSCSNNYFLLNLIHHKTEQTVRMNLQDKTCPFHSTNKMDFYCKTDKMYICSGCFLSGDHLGHDVVHTSDELDVYKRQVSQYIKTVEEKHDRLELGKEKFMNYLGEYQSQTRKTISTMEDRFKTMIQQLTKRKEEILKKYNNTAMNMNKFLKNKITILNRKQEALKGHINESKALNLKICKFLF